MASRETWWAGLGRAWGRCPRRRGRREPPRRSSRGAAPGSRLGPLAEPGGIAISQTVYDLVKARPEIQTLSLGPKELKDIKEAVNEYKGWSTRSTLTSGLELRRLQQLLLPQSRACSSGQDHPIGWEKRTRAAA